MFYWKTFHLFSKNLLFGGGFKTHKTHKKNDTLPFNKNYFLPKWFIQQKPLFHSSSNHSFGFLIKKKFVAVIAVTILHWEKKQKKTVSAIGLLLRQWIFSQLHSSSSSVFFASVINNKLFEWDIKFNSFFSSVFFCVCLVLQW